MPGGAFRCGRSLERAEKGKCVIPSAARNLLFAEPLTQFWSRWSAGLAPVFPWARLALQGGLASPALTVQNPQPPKAVSKAAALPDSFSRIVTITEFEPGCY
jgi:hypothetical protein